MKGLFAYGTLLFAPVLRAVVGRELPAVRAELDGFTRRGLIGELFPAIVEAPGDRVAGVLYEGLDDEAWRRLDAFEGALYERRSVVIDVKVVDTASSASSASGATVDAPSTAGPAVERDDAAPVLTRLAFTYVLSGSSRHRLAREPWSPDAFERDHLAGFEARLRGAAPGTGGDRGPAGRRPADGGDAT